jgi:hypothetical protein
VLPLEEEEKKEEAAGSCKHTKTARFPPAWPALISNRHGRLNFSSSSISLSTAAASLCNICIHAHIIYTVGTQQTAV